MLEDEAAPVDPVGVFSNGTRAGGNNCFTRGDSFPLGLLEKGDEVSNLVGSSLMEKKTERPPLLRANTESSLAKDLGALVLDLPNPKPDRHFVVRKKCSRVGRSTPQNDRRRMIKEREG